MATPSIREIATKLGISKSAVSLALNKPPEECLLAPATRERIIRAARKMGYRANTIAQTMRTGRFNAVSLITSSGMSYLPTEMAYGAETFLETKGNHLIVTWLDEEKLHSKVYIPKILDEWTCDGLLIHLVHGFPQHMQDLIGRFRIPSIWLNTKLKHDCVHPDDFAAAHAATARLIALGHRRIGYAHFYQFNHYSERDRLAGYEKAMRDAGLEPQSFLARRPESELGAIRIDDRHVLAASILSAKKRPTALLCYEIMVAGPIFAEALARGLQIPRDLSLVTFGALHRNDTGYPISTIFVNLTEVGRVGARLVLDKIEQPGKHFPPHAVAMTWNHEATMAPPR